MTNGNESPHHVPDDHSLIGGLAIGGGILIGLALCVVAFGCYVMESPPVAPSKMKLIRPGLPLADVHSLLGQPHRIVRTDDGTVSSWVYSPPLHWQIFYVRFDREGKVTESELDR